MKTLFIHFILGICTLTTPAQDVVTFKNGDVLSGEILEQNSAEVIFKTDTFGTVKLPANTIAEIQIEALIIGTVSIPAAAITQQEPAKPLPNKPQQVVAKESNSKSPDQKKETSNWSGQAGVSVAMRESNTLRRSGDSFVERDQKYETYRLYGNLKWKAGKNDLKWDWTYRYSKTDLRKNDDFFNITQVYKYDFTDKYFAGTKSLYQRDYRRGIDNEYLQTAEIGIKIFNTQKLKFSTAIGAGYHQYDRIQRNYSTAEGKFVLDESLRWQMINSLTLFQKYTHLGNFDKYHFVFTSGLENKLIRDIFLRFEYRLDRDTDVNYEDKSYYDKALLTSLLYKF